jgi:hypothetical protein
MMEVAFVDKKGKPQYVRWPLSLEAEIERMAEEEGISKVSMATRLVKMGIEVQKLIDSKFHMKDVRLDENESQGHSCIETTTKHDKNNKSKG